MEHHLRAALSVCVYALPGPGSGIMKYDCGVALLLVRRARVVRISKFRCLEMRRSRQPRNYVSCCCFCSGKGKWERCSIGALHYECRACGKRRLWSTRRKFRSMVAAHERWERRPLRAVHATHAYGYLEATHPRTDEILRWYPYKNEITVAGAQKPTLTDILPRCPEQLSEAERVKYVSEKCGRSEDEIAAEIFRMRQLKLGWLRTYE